MKFFLTILFICLLQNSFATTYYVSNSGKDANNGISTSTAWQTLSKVNATNLQPGDNVLLRRGDTFYGNIVQNISSSSSSTPITFGAYGSGNKPIITGFTSVTSWTNLGNNIWESTNPVSTLSNVKTVVVNGVNTPMGRYPNGDASYPYFPNFFIFQSSTGTGNGASSITSSSLSGGNNWTGADVVIRVNQWSFHHEVITSQSGSTLNFSGLGTGLTRNWGFFIQNDIRTLDQQNEWYYNPSTKKLDIYSTSMPTNVQVSTIDTLFYFYSNIPQVTSETIENIQFTGANTNAVWMSGNLIFSVTNCDFSYSGFEAMYLYGGGIVGGTINGNTFYNNGSSALANAGTVSHLTVTNNNINMSGVISYYKQDDYANGGIDITAPYSLVQYNTIDSSAYCGINFNGDSVQVRNNFINHSAIVRGDAAGIYTGYAHNRGKVIDGNVVLNSVGNPRGSAGNDYFAMGIYIDDLGNNISITNNTVANARTSGIYLHNSNNLFVRNNKIYNCGALGTEIMWANGGISMDANTSLTGNVYNNRLTNNIVFSTNQYQYNLNYYAENGSNGEVGNFGVIDSNYYVKINSNATAITSQQNGINGVMNLASWQSASGQDSHSQNSAKAITVLDSALFVYNPNNYDSTVTLPYKYQDVKGYNYDGSITLAPYSSAVLIFNGNLASLMMKRKIKIHFVNPLH